jgi:hypothetical protein
MTNSITITTSPDDALPVVTLHHQIYGEREISTRNISLRDHNDVRMAAEIELDLLDYTLQDVPVIDARDKF